MVPVCLHDSCMVWLWQHKSRLMLNLILVQGVAACLAVQCQASRDKWAECDTIANTLLWWSKTLRVQLVNLTLV